MRSTRRVARAVPAACSLARRMRKPLTCLIALCLCTEATAGAAEAKPLDGTYRGKTSQGHKTVAKVKQGRLKHVSFRWLGHCRDKGYVWGPMRTFWTDTRDGPIEQHGGRFTDEGKIHWHVNGERAL